LIFKKRFHQIWYFDQNRLEIHHFPGTISLAF